MIWFQVVSAAVSGFLIGFGVADTLARRRKLDDVTSARRRRAQRRNAL
jgi:hypothetical protein